MIADPWKHLVNCCFIIADGSLAAIQLYRTLQFHPRCRRIVTSPSAYYPFLLITRLTARQSLVTGNIRQTCRKYTFLQLAICCSRA